MSKIKDLYAEVEGIDDLMPPQSEKDRLKKILWAKAKRFMNLEDWLYDRAEFDYRQIEDGGVAVEMFISTLPQLAEMAATDLVEGYIESEHYDMSDELYNELIDWLGAELVKDWEDIERVLVRRKLDDGAEAWERRVSFYNKDNLGV